MTGISPTGENSAAANPRQCWIVQTVHGVNKSVVTVVNQTKDYNTTQLYILPPGLCIVVLFYLTLN